MGEDGYRMDNGNIEAVTALKDFTPKTVSDVRVLLGMLRYHRRHIQDFSAIAKPITNDRKATNAESQNEKCRGQRSVRKLPRH